jgi:hypothetical protein
MTDKAEAKRIAEGFALTIDDEIAINSAISKALGVGKSYYAPTELDADDATEAVMDYLRSRPSSPPTPDGE